MVKGRYLVVIVGPTASGKTSLAIDVARYFDTEIISADSRQLYKEMQIGTAKPSAEELALVPHHFVNRIAITEDYSAGKFADEVVPLLDQLFQQHQVVVMAGGSGLYVNAVLDGFDELPKTLPGLREKLEERLEKVGIESLQQELKELDPVYYGQIDLQNPHRVIRALEVCISSGKPFSSLRYGGSVHRNFTAIKVGMKWDREALYQRINQRVDRMIEDGLLDEARLLHTQRGLNALETVGYKELFDHLEGKIDLETAVELIKRNTRRYAKRQLTWWRKDEEIRWFEQEEAEMVVNYIESSIT